MLKYILVRYDYPTIQAVIEINGSDDSKAIREKFALAIEMLQESIDKEEQ